MLSRTLTLNTARSKHPVVEEELRHVRRAQTGRRHSSFERATTWKEWPKRIRTGISIIALDRWLAMRSRCPSPPYCPCPSGGCSPTLFACVIYSCLIPGSATRTIGTFCACPLRYPKLSAPRSPMMSTKTAGAPLQTEQFGCRSSGLPPLEHGSSPPSFEQRPLHLELLALDWRHL